MEAKLNAGKLSCQKKCIDYSLWKFWVIDLNNRSSRIITTNYGSRFYPCVATGTDMKGS